MNTDALRAVLPSLSPRDQAFAASLLSSRRLSEKQAWWVDELVRRASTPKPEPVKVKVANDLGGIAALFATAAARLKHPAIVLSSPETGAVRLSVAGPRSKHPGTINVTTLGSFDDRDWLGRIDHTGAFEPSRKANVGSVAALLSRFAADPARVAAEHGRSTGACCFCNRSLEDKRSVAVGYGPTCADNYGLPWGA